MTITAVTPMSPRQKEAFTFMVEFFSENDQLPPVHVCAVHMGMAHVNGAYEIGVALEKKGYLERNAVGKYRFTTLGRTLAIDHLKSSCNARWPVLGANPLDCGDRPAGKAESTRDTTKPLQQDTGLNLSANVRPCRPAPVNGPLIPADYAGSSALAR